MRHWTGFVASVVLATVGLTSSLQAKFDAGLINVSFGNKETAYEGKGVIGADGDKWNAPEGENGDKVALENAKKEKTDVAVSFAGTGVWDAEDAGFIGTPFEKLLRHYLFSNDAQKVTLTGLTPKTKYDVIVYSASNADGRKTKFTIGSDSKTTTYATEKKELAEDVNYAKFSATADDSGNLVLTYEGVEGGEGNLNAIQITPAAK